MAKRQAMNAGRLRLLNPLARAAATTLPPDRREDVLWRLCRPGWQTFLLPSGEPLKLWADAQDPVTALLVRKGIAAYEPSTLPVATALAKQARTIFDVGAHIGLYSLCMALANPDAHIFAFEPVDVIYERLVKNVVVNDMPRITCVNAAVGNTQGLVPLFSPAADKLNMVASTAARHQLHWPQTYECEFVAQTTLDFFAQYAEIDQVDLLKIDVEQAEVGVLEGMTSLLSKQPHIICEVLPGEFTPPEHIEAIAELVASYGYRIFLLTPDGPLLRQDVKPDKEHWNQLFTTMSADEIATALIC